MSENGYIPRFERDLQNAEGDLSALAEKRLAQVGIPRGSKSSSAIGTIRDDNTPAAQAAAAEVSLEDELPDIDFVYGNDDYDPTARVKIDPYKAVLEDVGEPRRVRLEDMRTPRNASSETLRAQMMEFDMANEVLGGSMLNEMSETYGRKKTSQEIAGKEILDRNEKEALRNRLKEEMGTRPQGFNQRRSLEMYHKLMDEQDAKEAQRGFFMLLILAALGWGAAALEHFLDLNPDGSVTRIYMDYLPLATAGFSIIMLFKAKFFKILSAIYFIANTAALLGPGLMVYVMDASNRAGESDFIIKLTMYVLAVIFSVVIFIRLLKDHTIAAYYSYSKRGRS
ncbi:MAG: hypothetical protein J1E40_00860 [Oscillospiraceae bacterium]|nr:hypothetical protein [Oscillospiraceae bacterium]